MSIYTTQRYGIPLAIEPGGSGYMVEIQRTATLTSGLPDFSAGRTIGSALPGQTRFVDATVPNDGAQRWYRARHVGQGATPGAWTSWIVSGVPRLLDGSPPVVVPETLYKATAVLDSATLDVQLSMDLPLFVTEVQVAWETNLASAWPEPDAERTAGPTYWPVFTVDDQAAGYEPGKFVIPDLWVAEGTPPDSGLVRIVVDYRDASGNVLHRERLSVWLSTGELIGAGEITETLIADGAISTPKLQANAVTANEINVANLAAISASMGTLTAGKIQAGSIELDADLETLTFGAATLPFTGVGIWMGKSGADYKFRVGDPAGNYLRWNGSVLDIVGDGTGLLIDGANLGAGSVDNAAIAADAITATELAANAVLAANIAAGEVGSTHLAADSVQASHVDAGAITAQAIAAGAVIAGKIAADAVGANEIAALAITAGHLAANTITAGQIAANTITGSQITGTTLSGIFANLGTITAGKIDVGSIEINAGTERILFGAATAPLTGTGIFMGKDGADYEFRVGNPAASYIHWDGTNLRVDGDIYSTDFKAATIGVRSVEVGGTQGEANNITWKTWPSLGSSDVTLLLNEASDRFELRWGVTAHLSINSAGTLSNAFFEAANGAKVTGDLQVTSAFNHDGTTFGIFGTTPQTQYTDYGALSDSTGGSAGSSLGEFTGGTFDDATVNNNFARVNNKLSSIRVVLRRYGLMT